MHTPRHRIEQLERAFWQSMVDDDPKVATGMLADTALMVSGHGAMSFDHAGYTKMAKDPSHRLVQFKLSDMDVMFPSDGHKAACHHEFQKHYRKVVVKIPIVHQEND